MKLVERPIEWMEVFLCVLIDIFKVELATKCPYCSTEFESINRHTWRCKARITSSVNNITSAPQVSMTSPISLQTGNLVMAAPKASDETCVCGRKCKGRRGLKVHQRACGAYRQLGKTPVTNASIDTLPVESVLDNSSNQAVIVIQIKTLFQIWE